MITTFMMQDVEELIATQLLKKFPAFVQPEDSLPYSKEATTSSCPNLVQYSPHPHIPLLLDLF
jgi:hypothetical protein